MSALFFDLDGTLTDSAPGITRCLAYAFRELGAPVPSESELRRCIGPPLDHTFRRLLPARGDAEIARAIVLYRERFVAHGMYENAVYDGIPECLAALRDEGRRLFVVTAKPERFAKEIVRHFALAEFFEAVYGPSEDGGLQAAPRRAQRAVGERSSSSGLEAGDRSPGAVQHRSDPLTDKGALVAHVLRSERIDAAHATMIGDRAHDVLGARQNGAHALGALWGYGSRAELEEAGAHALLAHPAEIARALAR